MIEILQAAEIYLASCTTALHADKYEIVCEAKYKAGDKEWDAEADDYDDVDGMGYMQSSKVAKEPIDD